MHCLWSELEANGVISTLPRCFPPEFPMVYWGDTNHTKISDGPHTRTETGETRPVAVSSDDTARASSLIVIIIWTWSSLESSKRPSTPTFVFSSHPREMSTSTYSGMGNPSWFLYGPHSAKLQDRPVPSIRSDHDVVIRIKYIGVCGSDVSMADCLYHHHLRYVYRELSMVWSFGTALTMVTPRCIFGGMEVSALKSMPKTLLWWVMKLQVWLTLSDQQ